jgi:two-component sensor histidine kinase
MRRTAIQWGSRISTDPSRDSASFLPGRSNWGRSLARGLANAGITVIYQDPDLRVVWASNVPAAWGTDDIVGMSDADYLHAAEPERVLALKQAVLDDGRPQRLEMRQNAEVGGRWYDMWLDGDKDACGSVIGVVTTLVEATGHKHREQTLRTLLREVSHRSKNLLAIIQSIATQTGRYSGSIDVFLNRFRGRLQSLASSQDIVTSSNWRGARLSELLEGQASRYCEDPAYSIRLEGANPHLNPNAALHIGLALHELVVNSMSHGALSRPNGYVTLTVRVSQDDEGHRQCQLLWKEKANVIVDRGKPVKRFGSIALERVVPASLDGTARLTIADGAVEYALLVPGANFELD